MIFQDLVETCSQNKLLRTLPALINTDRNEVALLEKNAKTITVVMRDPIAKEALLKDPLKRWDSSQREQKIIHPKCYLDFIEEKNKEIKEGVIKDASDIVLNHLFHIKNYKPFLVPVNQMIEFMYSKIEVEDLNYFFSMKMPFEKMFIDFNGTLFLDNFKIKGIFVERTNEYVAIKIVVDSLVKSITDELFELNKQFKHLREDDMKISWENGKDLEDITVDVFNIDKKEDLVLIKSYCEFSLTFQQLMVLATKLEIDTPALVISKDNKNIYNHFLISDDDDEKKSFDLVDGIKKMVIGFCLYVNAVNVEIIKEEGAKNQTKKRRQQERPIPEDYYFCKLETREVHVSDQEHFEGKKHSYQYDVRGHFAHYKNTFHGKPVREYSKYNEITKSIMVWRNPHRRGLTSGVYRPKTYLVNK